MDVVDPEDVSRTGNDADGKEKATFQENTSVDSEAEVKGDQEWGQEFQYTSGGGTYDVDAVQIRIRRESGTSAQNITVSIRSSWGGSDLASDTIASSSLGTSQAWVEFDMGGVNLTDGTTYIIRIDSSTTDGKIWYEYDSSGDPYGSGDLLDKDGNPLSANDADGSFRVIGLGSGPSVVTGQVGDGLDLDGANDYLEAGTGFNSLTDVTVLYLYNSDGPFRNGLCV